jgi:hypothetical protein
MSTEQNKAIVQRIAESGGAWAEVLFEALDPGCTFPFVARYGLPPTLQGFGEFWIPVDGHILDGYTIDEIVAEDDKVMTWTTFTKVVTEQAVQFFRFNEEGKIIELNWLFLYPVYPYPEIG